MNDPHIAPAIRLTEFSHGGGLPRSACAADARETVLELFCRRGFAQATEVGRLDAGSNVTIVA